MLAKGYRPTKKPPTTAAGRALEQRLAYDRDPAHYEPGDFFIDDRRDILAIEAEARASLEAEIERLRAAALALLNWYDGPPFVYEESDMETRLNALRAALEEPTGE